MKRLKRKDIPLATAKLLSIQGRKCPLCLQPLGARTKKRPALDHDHITGYLRDVLCINCNGMEGKIHNLVRRAKGKDTKIAWLSRLLIYWERHETPQHGGVFHPDHKTEEEKRLARNAKAVRKRKAAKK